MFINLLHDRLAITALMFIVILAVWGIWRLIRGQGINGSMWGALTVAEIVIIIQGLMGIYLWFSGGCPNATELCPSRGGVHILYGVASVLVIPGIFAFTRGGSDRRALFIYVIALLFLAGLVIRGIATAT
jgi:hypothetical protein